MLYHSVVLAALTGILSPAAAGEEPLWQKDYGLAKDQASKEKKPLAVVIGSGIEGWEKLSQEGTLSKEAKRLLAAHYICVYVDTEHINGQHLASDFEVGGSQGLVISDGTGHLQAFRHEGDLSNKKLEEYLERYADPDRVVQVTDSNPGNEIASEDPFQTGTSGTTAYPVSNPAYNGGITSCRT